MAPQPQGFAFDSIKETRGLAVSFTFVAGLKMKNRKRSNQTADINPQIQSNHTHEIPLIGLSCGLIEPPNGERESR
jgi:hypothetical protein